LALKLLANGAKLSVVLVAGRQLGGNAQRQYHRQQKANFEQ
jgi:hypothetical protein